MYHYNQSTGKGSSTMMSSGSGDTCLRARYVPYVVLISEHDDGPGIGGLQQASDDLVKLPWPGLPGDLQGLGDTHTTWDRLRQRICILVSDFHLFIYILHSHLATLS